MNLTSKLGKREAESARRGPEPRSRRARSRAAAPSADLAARYREVRGQTERLASHLSAEDCTVQSMPDASPVKWHLGHTSWFFETFVLQPGLGGYRPFDPAYRVLFNSYYNTVGDQHPRPERGLLTRPPLEEVLAFRGHVDRSMERLLENGGRMPAAARNVIELGLNHEQQHQELILTDVKHLLSRSPLRPAYVQRAALGAADGPASPASRWVPFPEGVRSIGWSGPGFAFDNEGPRHRSFVPAFEIASRPVTNAEYLTFLEDQGYERADLWLSDGWDTIRARGWSAPLYWERQGRAWREFTLAGLRVLDPLAPVCHASYYEADAYARWAGARLPTEGEWEVACEHAAPGGNFLESGLLHPSPGEGITRERDGSAGLPGVRRKARASSGDGQTSSRGGRPRARTLLQMFGDVWEWTASAYSPYPGYRPPAGALGEYNGKFMCNQLVLRGGSCATPASHIRPTYRNFFPPHARWQFTGIRLARDLRS